jgi:hypothetical protein
MVTKATAHPDRRLISSEDVQGTEVYGAGDQAIGEIDHLLIEKVSGRVTYALAASLVLVTVTIQSPGRHSSTTLTSAAIVRALPKDGYVMRLSSVTTRGKIVTGKQGPTSTTACPATGALRDEHFAPFSRSKDP